MHGIDHSSDPRLAESCARSDDGTLPVSPVMWYIHTTIRVNVVETADFEAVQFITSFHNGVIPLKTVAKPVKFR